ncbi:MAG: extracellular solute-binding protein [Clostridia bacterium]|nr:extracellular solute-binding protein [Clostridia bacterium]
MKKRKIALALASTLALSMLATACGDDGKDNSKRFIVDLGSLMPTENTTASVDNPEVIQASRYIAEAYKEEKGLSIEWATNYGRNISDNLEATAGWYGNMINSNRCPVIGFTSLNAYQDRDYYIVLDEYLERPNPYVPAGEPGSVHWKDMFYDYVWDSASIKNVKGEVVAIPILLSAGAQTGIFYNKDLIEKRDIPDNWQDFTELMKDINDDEDYRSFQPYNGYTTPGLYQWAMEFSLTPNVLKWMTEEESSFNIDYDKDGTLTSLEVLRGVMEGKFDPTKEGPAQAVYNLAYDYYVEALPHGWGTYTYKTAWDEGSLAMWDNGIWNVPMENSNVNREFEYGIFLTPLADSTTDGLEDYAVETEYYKNFDEVECPVSVALNVMKPAVKNDPEKLEKAIDFLMYLTTVDNISDIANEKGGTKGAVKGSSYYEMLDEDGNDIGWTKQDFPKVSYSAAWPTGYTSLQSQNINDQFAKWVDGNCTNAQFYAKVKEQQKIGAEAYIEQFNIDTTGWDIK